MKIALTGATSFTGMWFCKMLAQENHELFSFILKDKISYEGTRGARLSEVEKYSTPLYAAPFGSDAFLRHLDSLTSLDIFCHHAADVADYKSPDFNPIQALEKNTHRLVEVLRLLKKKGCHTLVLTGSVFEPNEGAGSDNLRAVSPYGLSKGLTSEAFRYYCEREGLRLKKFVIPNPFGPFEEVRFTTFLAKTWLEGKTAPVTMPDYVRDNIPVTLLAKAYADFVTNDLDQLNPSGFVESQGKFTERFHKAMKTRLNVSCAFEIKTQVDFAEPLVRYNTDKLDAAKLKWDEEAFWDDLAAYYRDNYAK